MNRKIKKRKIIKDESESEEEFESEEEYKSESENESDEDFEEKKTNSPPKKKSYKKEIIDIEDLGDYHQFSDQEVTAIRNLMLEWFEKNKRKLPWRNDESEKGKLSDEELNNRGYSVWVSEMMLQQTRVQTVIAYYEKWMTKWPSISDLAKTTIEVNEIWSGLGYYKRAKFLYEGANYIMENFNGKMPRTAHELEKIPGIGKYTAGAIASIAFGQKTPLVDGNVIRVLSRLRSIGADQKKPSITKLYWKLAGDLVAPNFPGSFNQSLMELGAILCTAQNPQCSNCPVRTYCNAYKEVNSKKLFDHKPCEICGELDDPSLKNSVTKYPKKTKKPSQRKETVSVCILEYSKEKEESYYLLVQRPSSGLLANLWEFPQVVTFREGEGDKGEEVEEEKDTTKKTSSSNSKKRKRNKENSLDKPIHSSVTLENYIKKDLGFGKLLDKFENSQPLGQITHLFSHIRQTLDVEWRKLSSSSSLPSLSKSSRPVRWVTKTELSGAAISKSVTKCFTLMENLNKQPKIKPIVSRKKITSQKKVVNSKEEDSKSKEKQQLISSMFSVSPRSKENK